MAVKRETDAERQYGIEFGNAEFAWCAAGEINVVRQVRDVIERDDAMRELKASLIVDKKGDGVDEKTELLNMITVGMFDLESLALYLEDLNIARGEQYVLDNFKPMSKANDDKDPDTYLLLINGNRRLVAMTELGAERGYTPDRIGIFCRVEVNPRYIDAARSQLNENTYSKPTVTEESRLVVDIYNLQRRRYGNSYDVAACASELSIGTTRVREALAYIGLPDLYKELIAKGPDRGGITYSLGLQMARVQREAKELYTAKADKGELKLTRKLSSIDAYVLKEMEVCMQLIFNRMIDTGKTATSKMRQFVTEYIAKLTGKMPEEIDEEGREYTQEGFDFGNFELAHQRDAQEVDVVQRGMRAARRGGRLAVGSLYMALIVHPHFLQELGVLPSDLELLGRAFTDAARNRGDHNQNGGLLEQGDLLLFNPLNARSTA